MLADIAAHQYKSVAAAHNRAAQTAAAVAAVLRTVLLPVAAPTADWAAADWAVVAAAAATVQSSGIEDSYSSFLGWLVDLLSLQAQTL